MTDRPAKRPATPRPARLPNPRCTCRHLRTEHGESGDRCHHLLCDCRGFVKP